MDILIKKIGTLSKECNECLRTYIAMNDGDENLIGSFRVDCKGNTSDCPLVALPSDHGTIADISELAINLYLELKDWYVPPQVERAIKKVFDEAPDILEARYGHIG